MSEIETETKFKRPFPRTTPEALKAVVTSQEEEFRYQKFPDESEFLKLKRIECTTCGKDMKRAITRHNSITVIECLDVLVCTNCKIFYNNGKFTFDEDGSDEFCRWCGQGGQLYCCSYCSVAICARCVKRNLPKTYKKEIEQDDWKCFICSPEPIWFHRAICYAAKQFVENQRNMSSTRFAYGTNDDNEIEYDISLPRFSKKYGRESCMNGNCDEKPNISKRSKNNRKLKTSREEEGDMSTSLEQSKKRIRKISSNEEGDDRKNIWTYDETSDNICNGNDVTENELDSFNIMMLADSKNQNKNIKAFKKSCKNDSLAFHVWSSDEETQNDKKGAEETPEIIIPTMRFSSDEEIENNTNTTERGRSNRTPSKHRGNDLGADISRGKKRGSKITSERTVEVEVHEESKRTPSIDQSIEETACNVINIKNKSKKMKKSLERTRKSGETALTDTVADFLNTTKTRQGDEIVCDDSKKTQVNLRKRKHTSGFAGENLCTEKQMGTKLEISCPFKGTQKILLGVVENILLDFDKLTNGMTRTRLEFIKRYKSDLDSIDYPEKHVKALLLLLQKSKSSVATMEHSLLSCWELLKLLKNSNQDIDNLERTVFDGWESISKGMVNGDASNKHRQRDVRNVRSTTN